VYNPHASLEGKSSSHKIVPQKQLWKVGDNAILKAPESKTRSASQIGSHQLTIFSSAARGSISAVNGPNDSVTGASSKGSNDEGLESSPECRTLRANSNPVLDVSEHQKDDSSDANGDEQGMSYVMDGKVRNHWDETTWERQH
jgi:hypothetical protein